MTDLNNTKLGSPAVASLPIDVDVIDKERTPLVEGVKLQGNSFLLDLFKSLHLGGCFCCNSEKIKIVESLRHDNMTIEDYYKYGRKNYKQCMCKNNVCINKNVDNFKYYVIYNNGDEVSVSKETFNKIQGKVLLYKEYTLKYVYPIKGNVKKLVKIRKNKLDKDVKLQSVFSVLARAKEMASSVKECYSTVSSTTSSGVNVILNMLRTITKKCKKIPDLKRYVVMIRDIFTPLVSIFGLITSLCIVNLAAIVGNIITIFRVIEEFDKSNEERMAGDIFKDLENIGKQCYNEEEYFDANDYPHTQTMENLLGAATVQFLPKWMQKTLSTFTSLTSAKLLDDSLLMARFFRTINTIIFTILAALVKRGVLSNESYNVVEDFLDGTCLGRYTYYVLCMEKQVGLAVLDPQLVNKISFQDECLKLYNEMLDDKINTGTYIERNQAIKQIYDQFGALIKLIKSNKDITRVEPICIMLVGKPGSGKSQTMGHLIELLQRTGKSVYSHTTPAIKVAKDFYDDYANQDVFVMDDVGQQGNSQWCQIINLVSPIKFGLPCATAGLKQTKYMTSQILLGTTNKLENLVFHKDDGVGEPEALFRRCDIINFDLVDMEYNKNGFKAPVGKLIYKHYRQSCNGSSGLYVDGFSPGFAAFAPDLIPYFEYEGKKDEDQLLWIYNIINARLRYKVEEKRYNIINFSSILDQIKPQVQPLFHNGEQLPLNDNNISTSPSLADKLKYYFGPEKYDVLMIGLSRMLTPFWKIRDGVNSFVPIIKDNLITILALGIGYTIGSSLMNMLCSSFSKKVTDISGDSRVQVQELIESAICKYNKPVKLTTADSAIRKNMRYACVETQRKNGDWNGSIGCVLISGGTIMSNFHSLGDTLDDHMSMDEVMNNTFITVYADFDKKSIMYDHVKIEPLYINSDEDIILWRLPQCIPSLLPDVSHLIEVNDDLGNLKLITPSGFIDIDATLQNNKYSGTIPFKGGYAMTLDSDNSISYEFSVDGACGSVVTNKKGKILGHHVAGGRKLGYARIWSEKVRTELVKQMNTQRSVRYKIAISDEVKENCSIVKCDNINHLGGSVPKDTKIVPSEVFEVFPLTRLPVNLNQPNIIKDVAKKSYKHVKRADVESLKFARQYLLDIVPRFSKVSEREVVIGTGKSSCINKKTSCGFGFKKSKEQYLDYDLGCYKDELRVVVDKIKDQVKNGEIDPELIMYIETLKDELRDERKVDKPRCFKMSPLAMTCIGREYFLDLIDKVQENRHDNGIMIGVNPFEEWEKIYLKSKIYDGCVDGDYGEWDGSMLTQFQVMVAEVLKFKCDGDAFDKDMISFFMSSIIQCITLNMNEILITTHGMPSGCMLTAIFNCLINKAYTAYGYHQLMTRNLKKPCLMHFKLNFFSYVYGDDILMFIKGSLLSIMNGKTYADICVELGLTFTTADKISDIVESKGIEDCQFLKRGFRFDNKLGYVCPLDKKSMQGTLNFISQKDRRNELTQIKIWNFQREALLHGLDYYNESTNIILKYVLDNKLSFNFLGLDYLYDLYLNDKDSYILDLMWDKPDLF